MGCSKTNLNTYLEQQTFKRAGFNNYKPVITNKNIELKEFLYEKGRIQEISYPNDAKWGYRSSIQLPTLHSS